MWTRVPIALIFPCEASQKNPHGNQNPTRDVRRPKQRRLVKLEVFPWMHAVPQTQKFQPGRSGKNHRLLNPQKPLWLPGLLTNVIVSPTFIPGHLNPWNQIAHIPALYFIFGNLIQFQYTVHRRILLVAFTNLIRSFLRMVRWTHGSKPRFPWMNWIPNQKFMASTGLSGRPWEQVTWITGVKSLLSLAFI